MRMADNGLLTVITCHETPKIYIGDNNWGEMEHVSYDLN